MSINKLGWQAVALVITATVTHNAWGQSYFDTLSARPDVVHAIAFRSLADVEAYRAPNNHDDVDYDSSVDSMRFRWPEAGGGNNIDQVQVDIEPAIQSGSVFVTWEERWSSEWASAGDRGSVNGISTHKNYQYSDAAAYDSGGLQLEVRMGHRSAPIGDNNVPAGDVGYVDIRSYFGNREGGDRLIGIQNDVLVGTEMWHRYFLFIEYGGTGKVSLWLTDKSGVPVNVYYQATGDSSGDPGPFASFWFEHNSSQDYSGPTSYLWNRNLVILDGVADINEAIELVNLGADGDFTKPNPPSFQ